MLTELSVTDYAVIDHLRLSLGPGLNVLTGETGAGKSIILGALGLLLGERADASTIRTGADGSYVEGVFQLDDEHRRRLEKILEADIEDGLLILGREVSATGRNACRINSRTVPRKVLQEVGAHLVDVHGQGTHLSLLRPSEQRALLDRFGGLAGLQGSFARLATRVVELRTQLTQAGRERQELAEKYELMAFQHRQIEAAALEPGEEEALGAERSVLANAQSILELVAESSAGLDADETPEPAALQLLGRAVRALSSLEQIDSGMAQARERAEAASVQVVELARDLREYAESVSYDPHRLAEVEERLELISTLKRKYGPSVEEVIAFGEELSGELARAEGTQKTHHELEEELNDTLEQAAELAVELDLRRAEAAGRLTAATEEQLRFLGMDKAQMAVAIRHRPHADGLAPGPQAFVDYEVRSGRVDKTGEVTEPVHFGAPGAADVEFLISTNPGEPLKPLATVASGGETSRLMLAIKTALAEVDDVPTLIFDEVDAGIGGRTGEAVGLKLADLGRRHQVLVVTHLPQIAAHGGRQFSARKVVEAGRTTTSAVHVEGEDRLEEITGMLGSDTAATRQKAAELLAQAAERATSDPI